MRVTLNGPWLLLATLLASGCRGVESEEPPVHLIGNMDTQEKGKAYRRDTSGLFADGRVMRLPVEGTVPQGSLAEDDVLALGLGPDGQPSLSYPANLTVDDAFRARGRVRYQIYCTPCHGASGDGKGPVAARGLVVPPPSMHDPRLKTMPVGRIYVAIKDGVNNHNMPPYAAQIPVADRWAIVAFVRQLQMAADPTVAEQGGQNLVVAAATKASAEHGAQLFQAKICNSCHNTDETKKVGPGLKGVFGRTAPTSAGDVVADDAYLKESILNPQAKIVTGYPPAMPPAQVSEIELQSLILYLKTLK